MDLSTISEIPYPEASRLSPNPLLRRRNTSYGWWRKGDIRVKKQKKTFECWLKTPSDVPEEAQDSIKTVLTVSQHNFGKDEYIVDLEGHEKQYWLGTESGLLGELEGFQVRGGLHSRRRYDGASRSMEQGSATSDH